MKQWYEKHVKAMQLNGKGERTQQAYVRALRMLVEFYGKSPDHITEDELQDYFIHRKNVTKWSPKTMRICYCGIRFFYRHVLVRDWHTLNIIKAQEEHRLPAVLSQDEVRRILRAVATFHNYAFLLTIYSCGLRLQEGLYLQVGDIDSQRMMIHVHRGKGAKDRYVPLPKNTLHVLRRHWLSHRNPTLLFPAYGRGGNKAHGSDTPMAKATAQGAFRDAKLKAGTTKRGVSLHTLRHSYATHLLEAGVNLRVIQRYMGHASIETTALYLHLTQKGCEDAYNRIDALMENLDHGDH